MPYKRANSPFYYVRRRTLPGYGDTGRLSSKTTSKKIARDIERCLEELARKALVDPSWTALLDAVCKDRMISPTDLLAARSRGELESIKAVLHDPKLTDAVRTMRALRGNQKPVRVGLGQLLRYIPRGARLSLLRDGRTITELCHKCEDDPKRDGSRRHRNSVRRYMLRSISLLLRHYVGAAERNRIFADVNFPAEDDTRHIVVSPGELGRLFDACRKRGYRELEVLIRLALQTSADRGVLLSGRSHNGKMNRGLLVADVTIMRDNGDGTYLGEVYFEDRKTKTRSRTVAVGDDLSRELLVLCNGKAPEEPLFEMRYMDLDYPWKVVREAAKMSHIRFKDLRAQTAIYAERAGIPQAVISAAMGHTSDAMTRRYQRHQAQLTRDHAQALESQFRIAK